MSPVPGQPTPEPGPAEEEPTEAELRRLVLGLAADLLAYLSRSAGRLQEIPPQPPEGDEAPKDDKDPGEHSASGDAPAGPEGGSPS